MHAIVLPACRNHLILRGQTPAAAGVFIFIFSQARTKTGTQPGWQENKCTGPALDRETGYDCVCVCGGCAYVCARHLLPSAFIDRGHSVGDCLSVQNKLNQQCPYLPSLCPGPKSLFLCLCLLLFCKHCSNAAHLTMKCFLPLWYKNRRVCPSSFQCYRSDRFLCVWFPNSTLEVLSIMLFACFSMVSEEGPI